MLTMFFFILEVKYNVIRNIILSKGKVKVYNKVDTHRYL